GFWLGDAVASGGLTGYNHKKMGSTARGAWESVKRHFREMGIDVQTTDFTCVGIGDMSGDVFGNGMLNSRHIKLTGAFNHLHIFIDPDPDPAASIRERRRLFRLSRSSWSDYNAKLISRGGGVFERSAKSIKLTPRMRALYDLPKSDSVTPNEMIRAMLGAPVDLLWFGGIGTYFKARAEAHLDAGDRANDAIRLNGREVRAKVLGEGANLGVTQLGRVEYALAGGRINTDFIDNSAGVDCSDHEVNIKITLGDAVAGGRITTEQRNALLVEMTDEVAELVLMDNYRQSMALTNVEHQGVARLDDHARFMRALERAGKLDRAVEFLPDDETLDQRRADRQGLLRPEMSVLLAYAKITLLEDLLDSDVPDDPYLTRNLGLYFPKPMREKFADLIANHRLRREITATYVTNSLVNRTGPSFITNIQERTGAHAGDITRAYLVCRRVYQMAELWADVESLDNDVPADIQTTMHLAILDLIQRGTLWFLRSCPRPLDIDGTVEAFAPGVEALRVRFKEILAPDLKSNLERRLGEFVAHRVPPDIAHRIAGLNALVPACDIVRIAAGAQLDPCEVGSLYYGLGERFGLDWLRGRAETLSDGNEWQKMAVAAVIDDLYAHQSELTTKVLDTAGDTSIADAVIDTWTTVHRHTVGRVQALISELRTSTTLELAMLAVANREIRSLVEAK
ncbi:MAG: NAD-glutamate dehydrogenase, partial [Gammaproteobacteria bacterium]|nr:NAD-glutamate dehydrogenase [Gammaproteobacteria bacterium]